MPSGYTSNELVHFVGSKHPLDDEANYATLRLIMESGEIRTGRMQPGAGVTGYYTRRDRSSLDGVRVEPNVTCFADIPSVRLGIHVSKYGRFGLAFDRVLMARRGTRPVMYVPYRQKDFFDAIGGKLLLRDIDAIHESFLLYCEKRLTAINRAIEKPRSMGVVTTGEANVLAAAKTALELYFMSYVKAFDVELAEHDLSSYYMEREWRKHGNLEFKPSDVAAIYVASGFVRRAKRDYPELADRVRRLGVSAPRR